MITEKQPAAPNPPKRLSYRFSLRTLMILVTVAALGSWVYLEGWPRLVIFWQERQFESGARQLKVGSVPLTGMQLVPGKNPVSTTYTSSGEGRLIGLTKYVWPNAVYCIYYVFPNGYSGGMMQAPCESVEVFRLPPVPLGYMARSEAGRLDAGQSDGKPGGAGADGGVFQRHPGRAFQRPHRQPRLAVRADSRRSAHKAQQAAVKTRFEFILNHSGGCRIVLPSSVRALLRYSQVWHFRSGAMHAATSSCGNSVFDCGRNLSWLRV